MAYNLRKCLSRWHIKNLRIRFLTLFLGSLNLFKAGVEQLTVEVTRSDVGDNPTDNIMFCRVSRFDWVTLLVKSSNTEVHHSCISCDRNCSFVVATNVTVNDIHKCKPFWTDKYENTIILMSKNCGNRELACCSMDRLFKLFHQLAALHFVW